MCESRKNTLPYPFGSTTEFKIRWWGWCVNPERIPSHLTYDVGFVIEFGGGCYQDTYPMYRACIVHVSRMYLDVSRSYTSRYIKIHQDTFVSCCLWHFSCILPRGMYPPSKIHLGYISDTMYLVFQIHDTQDTFKIHSGTYGIYVLHVHLSPMYPACIPHVSRMYLDYL